MNKRGFTLLEVMVATLIMGIAVVGLLSGISTSMRNAARLTEYDRAAMLSRGKMDELLLDRKLPQGRELEGRFDAGTGWRARIEPFESLPDSGPGAQVLEKISLEVWWTSGDKRKSTLLESYRRGVIPQPDVAP